MTEYQLSLEGNLRLFFAMAIIVCGYGYVIICVFIKDMLAYILMLLGLAGLSFYFLSCRLMMTICGAVLLI